MFGWGERKFGQHFCESCVLRAEILSTKWEGKKKEKKKISFEIFSIPSCLFTGQIARVSPVLVNALGDGSAAGAALRGWLHPINVEFAVFLAIGRDSLCFETRIAICSKICLYKNVT